jgi:hypothetical protein
MRDDFGSAAPSGFERHIPRYLPAARPRQGLTKLRAPQQRAYRVDDGVGQDLVVVLDPVGATKPRRLA